LIHVVDITHPNAGAQAKAVEQTLKEIGAEHIPAIIALNKIDQLPDPSAAQAALSAFPNAVAISALKGDGLDELLKLVNADLFENYAQTSVQIPYTEGQLISLFHEQGQVERIEHTRKGVFIQGLIPGRLLARFSPFMAAASDKSADDEVNESPEIEE